MKGLQQPNECQVRKKEKKLKNCGKVQNSLAVQWLQVGAPTAGGLGSILGQGTKILQGAKKPAKKKSKKALGILTFP